MNELGEMGMPQAQLETPPVGLDVATTPLKLPEKGRLIKEAFIIPMLNKAKEYDNPENTYTQDVMKVARDKIKEIRDYKKEGLLTEEEADEIIAAYLAGKEINGFIDTKTNLFNETGIKERLTASIKATERSGEPLSCAFIDLRGFKGVNDALGHKTGDKVLQYVADYIKSKVRSNDLVARLGGDEFTIVFDGVAQSTVNERFTVLMGAELTEYVKQRMQADKLDPNGTSISGRIAFSDYTKGDTAASLLDTTDKKVNVIREKEKLNGNYSR